ncbi:MAG: PKD domain-containing protein [Chitinophagales bacterium]
MVKGIPLLVFVLLHCKFLLAQLPEQDCEQAIPVCQSTYFQQNSYVGSGTQQELTYPGNTSCLMTGEQNSVWYIFTVTGAGDLEMQIAPNSPGDDYDWAIYNLTGSDCSGITTGAAPEVRCNYSVIPGSTGMAFPYLLISVPQGGPNQCAPLPVLVGETYVLIINNFANTFLGYTLNFTGNAVIYDTLPPTPVALEPFACEAPDTLHLTLSEPILCTSLAANGTDFYVTGPSPVNVLSAFAPACGSGNFFTDVYIQLTSPITFNGNYVLHFKNDNINYDVLLDNCGNELSFLDTVPFIVNLASAQFSYQLYNTCNGDSVVFTDASQGDIVNSWVWDFGDGTGSNLQNPDHVYLNSGTFTISLAITDTSGCFDKDSLVLTTYIQPPVATLAVSAGPYCAGMPVNFTSASTGQAITYSWNFGGSGTSNLVNPSFIFPDGGTYVVILTVTDTTGCFDTAQITLIILPELIADFSVNPASVCVGDTVTLSDGSLGNPTSFLWSGPGVDGDTATTVKTYFDASGIYTFTLSITGSVCPSDTVAKVVNVHDYPIVFLGKDTAICIDESITLDAGNPALYHLWSTQETTRFITINEVPQLVWVLVDDSGCITLDTIFVDSSCPFYVPNAFTPNGDGVNDIFNIITDGNQSFIFSIYNRWGQLLFQTTDPGQGWDGTYQGKPEEMGVYIYELQTVFTNGVKRVRKGNITLIL